MHNQIRVYLIDKVRDTEHGGWSRTVAQVWNKVDEKVHKYCELRHKVSNNVVRHLKGFR